MKYLLIAVLIVSGCKKAERNYSEIKIPAESGIILKGEQVFKSEVRSFFVDDIDEYVVVSSDVDPLFTVYDLHHNKLASFGEKGRGPNQFNHVIDISLVEINYKPFLIAFDYILLKVSIINLEESIQNTKTVIDQEIELPKELRGITDIFYLDDEHLAGVLDDSFYNKLESKSALFLYNYKTESLKIAELEVFEVTPYDEMALTNLNNSPAALSPNGMNIAMTRIYNPVLELYNSSLKINKRLNVSNLPIIKEFRTEDYYDGLIDEVFTAIDVTNHSVFLLKSGRKENEWVNNPKILQFDWNGNLLNQYVIPREFEISEFTFSVADSAFYGISYSQDKIFKFNE